MSTPLYPGTFAAILLINGRLLGAALTTFGAWIAYPFALQDWTFWLVVLLFGATAIALVARAILEAVKLFLRDRAITRYTRHARTASSARLAEEEELRRAGMIR